MRCANLFILAAAALLAGAISPASGADIVVDADQEYQTIEGFGTCLVSWVGRFRDLYRTEEFQKVYVNDVGCNMLRINLWGPVCKGPIEDWRKIRWQDFDMSASGGRAQVFVDFGQGIRKLDPDVKTIGTVWSPPAWMKVNNSITDRRSGGIRAGDYRGINNRVKPEYYVHFARWLVEMVKLHKAAGVPLYAVSPGNEVQFTQTFESCVWNGEDFVKIVTLIGKMLEAEGLGDVLIFGPETMTSHFYAGGTPDYVRAILADAEARKYFDVFATHGYEDGFKAEMAASSSRRFWSLIEDSGCPFWVTEGGTGGHDWPAPLQKGVAAAIHNSLVAGNVSAFVPWQVIDKAKTTHCLMTIEGTKPVFTPKTYAAMHYFRFIRPGAVRIGADPAYGDVKASAFLNKQDRTLTIVLLNPTDQEQNVTVRCRQRPSFDTMDARVTSASDNFKEIKNVPLRDGQLGVNMPPQSMVTLIGKGE